MISYTVPCHKREDDLLKALPSVLAALTYATEVVVVDYGNPSPLSLPRGVTRIGVQAEYFHMAHARNAGIKAARGSIVCAFVCDQIVQPNFFQVVRELIRPGTFLTWQETFVAYREDLIAAGGFDERFELYGPEGKELAERLKRRGLREVPLPRDLVYQIPTPYDEKIRNYRPKLSRREMHHLGMAVWRECQAENLMVANEGQEWGSFDGPQYHTYSDEQLAGVRAIIEQKKLEAACVRCGRGFNDSAGGSGRMCMRCTDEIVHA